MVTLQLNTPPLIPFVIKRKATLEEANVDV